MAKSNLPAHLASTTNMPAHLNTGVATGNEEVTSSDLAMPRIKLLQKISPELEEGHEKFVDGAKAGQFLNTVTNEAADELIVINLRFDRGYVAFKKKEFGGGFGGEFDSEAEAIEALQQQDENPAQYDIIQNHRHTLLILDDDGKPVMPAMMDFASTKIRSSKAWNSDIALKCNQACPRFGLVYKLVRTKQSNSKGSWFGLSQEFMGYASEDLFKAAQKEYEAIFGSTQTDDAE